MRLTLRTLLAYLDDRLSPGNARELGQKLANSPFATELAERIGTVVRRRRLAKESADQKTIDANLIAEYLDDQLTPELIALIEKEILASDQSLAEVAATHQILGLLSDPVEIDPALKERLYKLDPALGDEVDSDSAAVPSDDQTQTWQPLQKQAETQRRSPMILLAVMVLGWFVLLATDPKRDPIPGVASNAKSNEAQEGNNTDSDQAVAKPDVLPDQDDSTAAQNPDTTQALASTTTPAIEQPVTEQNSDIIAKPPQTAVEPDTVASTTPDVAPNVMPPKTATNSASEDIPPATEPDTPAPATPAVSRFVELMDTSRSVMLQDEASQWIWAESLGIDPTKNWADALSAQHAVIGSPFSARLVAKDAGWAAEVVGPAIFRVDESERLRIRMVEGRLLIRKYGNVDEPTPFSLIAGGKTVDIEIPENQSVVGVAVVAATPDILGDSDSDTTANLLPLDNAKLIRVSAPDQSISIRADGSDDPLVIAEATSWNWDSGKDITSAANGVEIAEWVFDAKAAKSQLQTELIAETAASLRKTGSITSALRELTEHKNPQIASSAVDQLSLLRSVDELVELMLKGKDEVVRHHAIAGLTMISNQTSAGSGAIRSSLETRLPEADLSNAMKLIRGVSKVGAEDRRTSAWLVGMLESSRVAFRDLAIFNLEELTGERNGFFASDESSRRSAAVRRWNRFLDRNDGRLIAPPE